MRDCKFRWSCIINWSPFRRSVQREVVQRCFILEREGESLICIDTSFFNDGVTESIFHHVLLLFTLWLQVLGEFSIGDILHDFDSRYVVQFYGWLEPLLVNKLWKNNRSNGFGWFRIDKLITASWSALALTSFAYWSKRWKKTRMALRVSTVSRRCAIENATDDGSWSIWLDLMSLTSVSVSTGLFRVDSDAIALIEWRWNKTDLSAEINANLTAVCARKGLVVSRVAASMFTERAFVGILRLLWWFHFGKQFKLGYMHDGVCFVTQMGCGCGCVPSNTLINHLGCHCGCIPSTTCIQEQSVTIVKH